MLHIRLNDCHRALVQGIHGVSQWVLEQGDILTGVKQIRVFEYNAFRGGADPRDDLSAHSFTFVVEGRAQYTLRGKDCRVQMGDFLYIPPLEEYVLMVCAKSYKVLAIDTCQDDIATDVCEVSPNIVRICDRARIDVPTGHTILQEKILHRACISSISDISITEFISLNKYESRPHATDLALYVLYGQAEFRVPHYEEYFGATVGDLVRIPAGKEFSFTAQERPFRVLALHCKPNQRIFETCEIEEDDLLGD